MRHNRLILAFLVFLTAFFICVPQAYHLYRHYIWQGEKLVANHVISNKAKNSKDTIMMPLYAFSRMIGPVKQECKIAVFERIHALDTPPATQTLTLKVGDTCMDYIILDDTPRPALILFALGFLLMLFSLNLSRIAWKTPKGEI